MTSDPTAFLAGYGLDAALTDADDPDLWAAVVAAHWPPVDDPSLNVAGLSFGFYGFYEAPWTFERVDGEVLRAVVHEEPPRGLSRPIRYPFLSVRIERPSAGKDRAFVDAGRTSGPLAGRGETRVWERVSETDREGAVDEGERWRPTEEVVSSWVS